MKIALLIIDVQKAYIDHNMGESEYNKTFDYINHTAFLFRESKKPVIIIRDLSDGDDENYANADELATDESDIEIIKYYGNSFWKTELEETLKKLDVDFVVLCGNAAEYCVLATYNGAMERGFGAAMLQNGIFAASQTGLLDIAFNRAVISHQVISYILSE